MSIWRGNGYLPSLPMLTGVQWWPEECGRSVITHAQHYMAQSTHLLSIEHTDWTKLHDMLKKGDDKTWQHRFPVGFPFVPELTFFIHSHFSQYYCSYRKQMRIARPPHEPRPSYPAPQGWLATPWAPPSCGMTGCWQIIFYFSQY